MAHLNGHKALVIGGSRGIGAAIVRRLARDGAEVVFTYHGSRDAAEALASEVGASAVQSDAGDPQAARAVVADAGPLDILVVNAGVAEFAPAADMDPDALDRMLDINVRGPAHAAAEAAKTMPEGGRIVFIGSVNGDRMPMEGGAGYAMTKSAIQGLTRGLARDLGARGITVNTVQPGPVDTAMNPADGPLADMMHGAMAIKRHAHPDEIAGMVAYLVGPEARIVTGAMHTIDGGFGA